MIERREFLRLAAQAGLVPGLAGLVARMALEGEVLRPVQHGGYGPLSPRPSLNTGETLLALPEGFQYTVFGRTGSPMADGRPTPPLHDGMAAFPYRKRVRLVRNHEVGGVHASPIGRPEEAYDPKAGGGCTFVDVDPATRLPLGTRVAVGGTVRNCAGGPTPWGTWITCEETYVGPAEGFDRRHGYCFEVPLVATSPPAAPQPLSAMGRFVHEAVAVDPATGIVYLTEDKGTAGFYRFVPNVPGRLAEGGTLEMLAVAGEPQADLRTGQTVGAALPVQWVPIAHPDPPGTNDLAVFQQGRALGGAMFARLEGCWHGNGKVYLNATSGGNAGKGQVWEFRPATQELALLFESASASVMDQPDNLCVSPRGGLVVCEDTGPDVYVRGLTPTGQVFDFAKNALNGSEFAGACFSPDGQTLFLNIQSPGVTLAVWGPWESGPL